MTHLTVDGYTATSLTNTCKALVNNSEIRKNITTIYYFHDDEWNEDFLAIYFKPETVKSIYSDEYMDRTDAKVVKGQPISYSLNEWLKEIAYI